MYPDFEDLTSTDCYSKVYQYKQDKKIAKVKLAHQIIDLGVDLDVLDLRERVTELVAFIEDANGLKTSSSGEQPGPAVSSDDT